jgi:hypothetical protein
VEQPEAWRDSMKMAAQEVLPKVRHLHPTAVAEAA